MSENNTNSSSQDQQPSSTARESSSQIVNMVNAPLPNIPASEMICCANTDSSKMTVIVESQQIKYSTREEQ